MHLAISVMPDVEAAYPGGLGSAIDYLRSSVLKNAPETDTSMISRRLTSAVIKFTLDENGKVIEARMDRSSSDEMLDKRLLEATFNMPAWTPAMNVHGEKMKRELSLSVDKRRVAGC